MTDISAIGPKELMCPFCT